MIRVALLGSLETFCLQIDGGFNNGVKKSTRSAATQLREKVKGQTTKQNGVHYEKKTRGQQWISTNFEQKRKDKLRAIVQQSHLY